MFVLLASLWVAGSLTLILCVLLARHRRGVLAGQLHELRGALTAARLAVELLPVESERGAQASRAAAAELARGSCSLVDFERLLHARLLIPPHAEHGPRPAVSGSDGQPGRFDPHHEIELLVAVWGAAARRQLRSIELRWNGPADGLVVRGERHRFASVITNLLANALIHGAGRITLSARVRSDSLRIEVDDQGPGLPGPLTQVIQRRSRAEHGRGLGLARTAARELGGSLMSAPSGSGARLVFTVPALHDPALALKPRERGAGS